VVSAVLWANQNAALWLAEITRLSKVFIFSGVLSPFWAKFYFENPNRPVDWIRLNFVRGWDTLSGTSHSFSDEQRLNTPVCSIRLLKQGSRTGRYMHHHWRHLHTADWKPLVQFRSVGEKTFVVGYLDALVPGMMRPWFIPIQSAQKQDFCAVSARHRRNSQITKKQARRPWRLTSDPIDARSPFASSYATTVRKSRPH